MKLSTYRNTGKVEFNQMVGATMTVCAPGATCQAPASMADTLKKYGLVETTDDKPVVAPPVSVADDKPSKGKKS